MVAYFQLQPAESDLQELAEEYWEKTGEKERLLEKAAFEAEFLQLDANGIDFFAAAERADMNPRLDTGGNAVQFKFRTEVLGVGDIAEDADKKR